MADVKVYLAGPISGLDYDEAQDWRLRASLLLATTGITAYSPLRAKTFLRGKGVLEQSYTENPLSTDRGIMTRDHWDCRTADLILVNLLGADRVSIGTVMEIAWGFAYRVPVVAAMDPAGNLHEHPMIREAISYRLDGIDSAIQTVISILTPGFSDAA